MTELRRMRRLAAALVGIAFCGLVQGCSYFGYYKYERPERIPKEVGERIRDPDPKTFVATTTLDGPTLAALQVALADFMPPGVKSSGDYEPLVRCFNRRDVMDVRINKVSDDLYLVSFAANLDRCGLHPDIVVMDAGATYLIDGQGRILDIR
ncbi:hypothetical protein G4177_01865 [Corallococcus sp. ZKHCc1 1396]|uniref:Lipoprotein n=1 Tax=Corallococcus soli TaxID=2710757 RepID=A0ABR9PG83_9BACT|nr:MULTISPECIES: hypothetical protein [Corallococcus]MBE4746918.1 hypothetical protein [Corallococcus soli]MCY1030461.1 hypothetical protein [Corallococcus sp. BB11-1]RYZ16569.1 MAG: hypothetical protein EOO70_04150 [Myxococcaceae bacterium]